MTTDQPQSDNNSDDITPDNAEGDNLHQEKLENSPNGLDSTEVTGGQNGRNIRAMGSQDMDSQHGILRMGDMDNSTMEVTEEGKASAVASIAKTDTSTVSVTTSGPDDYASDPEVSAPNAQKKAKKQDEKATDQDDTNSSTSQEETEKDVAETGTSTDHQPTY